MKTVGIVATVIAGVFAMLAAALLVMSIPDIKRYLKMRRM